jgi:hypothetical protein
MKTASNRGVAQYIVNLGFGQRSIVSFMPRPFTSSKTTPESKLDRRVDRPTLGTEQKYAPIQKLELGFPDFRAHTLVTVFTELPIN